MPDAQLQEWLKLTAKLSAAEIEELLVIANAVLRGMDARRAAGEHGHQVDLRGPAE